MIYILTVLGKKDKDLLLFIDLFALFNPISSMIVSGKETKQLFVCLIAATA